MTDPMWNLSGAWSGQPYTVKADHWLEDGQEETLAGFFCNCTPYPGPYIRLLLLLAERGRSL